MKVYLSGPMTGLPDLNRAAFAAAAARIRALGHEVFSPAEADAVNPDAVNQPLAWYLRRDIIELCQCDAVAVLPGWRESVGAQLEVTVARGLGMPVLDAGTMTPVAEETILEEAARAVYGARRKDYGHPRDNHARTAALWSAYLGTTVTPMQVCALNILQKLSRAAHHPTRDSLVDIAGYAQNMAILAGHEDMQRHEGDS